MDILYRQATAADFARCVEIRGQTNDNPLSVQALDSIGVNEQSWCPLIASGDIIGQVAEFDDIVVGFCFGDTESAEILALACLPEFENKGIGKTLLLATSESLFQNGAKSLWLAASADPKIRAHGFYRHLGWSPSGKLDHNGDEILELIRP